MIDHIEKYIELNVTTDPAHENDLKGAIHSLREANKTNHALADRLLVARLASLCLSLLGEMPNHRHEKKVCGNQCFLLNKARSIHYSQNAAQKCELVIRFLNKRVMGMPDEKDVEREQIWQMIRQYYEEYARYHKHAVFLRWFRENHPADYDQLFPR